MVLHLNEVIMTFKKNGYEVIRNFLEPEFVKFVQEYFFVRINAQQATVDSQAPFSYSFYADPLIETILGKSCNPLSDLVGFKLLPQYTYTRLYKEKDELVIHRDRPSCEISATLALGLPDGLYLQYQNSRTQDTVVGPSGVHHLVSPLTTGVVQRPMLLALGAWTLLMVTAIPAQLITLVAAFVPSGV